MALVLRKALTPKNLALVKSLNGRTFMTGKRNKLYQVRTILHQDTRSLKTVEVEDRLLLAMESRSLLALKPRNLRALTETRTSFHARPIFFFKRCYSQECLPPPCNTPPKCIQYMKGYYHYPYGWWFCGPYHQKCICECGPCAPEKMNCLPCSCICQCPNCARNIAPALSVAGVPKCRETESAQATAPVNASVETKVEEKVNSVTAKEPDNSYYPCRGMYFHTAEQTQEKIQDKIEETPMKENKDQKEIDKEKLTIPQEVKQTKENSAKNSPIGNLGTFSFIPEPTAKTSQKSQYLMAKAKKSSDKSKLKKGQTKEQEKKDKIELDKDF